MNNVFGEPWIIRHTSYFSDPAAGPDELLNDATEWLHYAYNSLKLLAELVDERGSIDAHRLPIMLDGIAAFVEMGTLRDAGASTHAMATTTGVNNRRRLG